MGRKATDLSGAKIGKLTVLKRAYHGRAKQGIAFWECLCECGNTTIVSASNLKKENIKSCGCGQKRVDLTGKKFGYWTVLSREGLVNNRRMWKCQCECGEIREVAHASLVTGKSLSCGCYHKKRVIRSQTTHGMSDTRLYGIFYNMKSRCNNPNNSRYKDYGARGIRVCEEWENSFDSFLDWALTHGYTEKSTIDRIDNDRGYFPENCRWVSMQDQRNNRRNTVRVEVAGRTFPLKHLCDLMQWDYPKYYARWRRKTNTFTEEELSQLLEKLRE